HSHQKMVLNSASVMPRLSLNWGIAWYLANSVCHAASPKGGSVPVTGFHSTIESPDSVSRVAPPTSSVATISAATRESHSRIARRRACGDMMRLMLLAELRADHIDGRATVKAGDKWAFARAS